MYRVIYFHGKQQRTRVFATHELAWEFALGKRSKVIVQHVTEAVPCQTSPRKMPGVGASIARSGFPLGS